MPRSRKCTFYWVYCRQTRPVKPRHQHHFIIDLMCSGNISVHFWCSIKIFFLAFITTAKLDKDLEVPHLATSTALQTFNESDILGPASKTHNYNKVNAILKLAWPSPIYISTQPVWDKQEVWVTQSKLSTDKTNLGIFGQGLQVISCLNLLKTFFCEAYCHRY